MCYSAEKQALEQARFIQRQDEDQEADAEEDDDDEEEDHDGDKDEVWRKRRGSPEGRPEPEDALRKRVVGSHEEEDT